MATCHFRCALARFAEMVSIGPTGQANFLAKYAILARSDSPRLSADYRPPPFAIGRNSWGFRNAIHPGFRCANYGHPPFLGTP